MYTKVLFYIDHFKCFNIAMMTKVCCNDCNEWTTSAVQWIVLARIMKCHRTKMSVQCDHCPGRARTRGTTHLQARPADCSAGVYRCGGGATRHPPLAATPLLSCSWHLRSSVELSHRPRLSPTTRTPQQHQQQQLQQQQQHWRQRPASEQQHSDTESALLPGYEDNHADKTKINVTNYLFQIVIETTAFQGRGLQW